MSASTTTVNTEENVVVLTPKIVRVEALMDKLCCAEGESDSATIDAVRHHFRSGGKRIRAKLALHAAERLALEPEDAVAVAACCELLHNASLIHDDLQDRDDERRGYPTVWRAFGDDVALLAGDLLLSGAYRAVAEIHSSWHIRPILRVLHRRIAVTILSQAEDREAFSPEHSDLSAYRKIAAGKSGPLLSLPIEMSLLLAGLDRFAGTAQAAAEAFAIGYQIVDDLEDVDRDDPSRAAKNGMNAIWVLRSQGAVVNAERQAAIYADEALAQAIKSADALPHHSGLLLATNARDLQKRLRERIGR